MPSWKIIVDSNSRITENETPNVAVFIGATSGIAKATLALLVSKQTAIKVYVVGRNESRNKSFLDQLRLSNPKANILWLEGLVSILSDVQRVCNELMKHETGIDLLFLSAGYLPFEGRIETSEGLDTCMSLQYWSRALFIETLLPLMTKAPSLKASYSPRVISISGAGRENISSLPLEDLDLKLPENYGASKVGGVVSTLNTVFLSRAARQQQNKNVVFIHNHPGLVKSGLWRKNWGSRSWGSTLMWLLEPLLGVAGLIRSVEVSAERCLYLITSAEYGGSGVPLSQEVQPGSTISRTKAGALFCVNDKIECLNPDVLLKEMEDNDTEQIVWQKTLEIVGPHLP